MKVEMPLPDAERIARGMVGALTPFCQRVEIAGSIRRRKRVVGDIEIVCIPQFETDMFGAPTLVSKLAGVDWTLYGHVLAGGEKYKKILLREGIQLDLFIVTPPAQFGVILMIRTGPADYSRKMVSKKQSGGFLPSCYQVKDGAVWSRNHIIETPEEFNYYELCGVPFLPPEKRK